jgi:hypothetical protein
VLFFRAVSRDREQAGDCQREEEGVTQSFHNAIDLIW